MPKLLIASPLAGWVAPLEEVPDATFAQRMVGDGLAIDPTNDTLHAPCDAEVVTIPASQHAVTLRTAGGAELLMHIGIDTVKLGGQGFTALVGAGARVTTGQPLIKFDLDVLAQGAPSLLTPVLLMEGGSGRIVRRWENCALKVGDPLFELDGLTIAPTPAQSPTSAEISQRFTVHFDHGIHARPAALLANAIKRYTAQVAIHAHGRQANVRSGVSLMALGARRGDEILVIGSGPDARDAIDALAVLFMPGAVAEHVPVARAEPLPSAPAAEVAVDVIRGVTASPGIAVGKAVQVGRPELTVVESGAGVSFETTRLTAGLSVVRTELDRRANSSSGALREVMEAHLAFLDDPELTRVAQDLLSQGKSAAFAWRRAVDEAIAALRTVDDPRVVERVADLDDLATQVLVSLEGKTSSVELPEHAIVLAKELLPSQFASLPRERVAGICTAGGGPTSHVAILAAAAGIPAIVAAGAAVLNIATGSEIFLNADRGMLHVSPSADNLRAAEVAMRERRERLSAARSRAHEECRTADGVRVEIFANVGSLADARAAVEQGAEGCGLLRSEFLFLDRESPPTEEEQREQYQAIVDAFAGRPVILRTLDAGGDKPIPYLPLPHEDNPALGLRGVRTSLHRPELLLTQLRAALAVRPAGQLRIMLPMINSVDEIRRARRVLDEARGTSSAPPFGIMVETPASALNVAQLSSEADFFSIGTNDLTQYTLAMDRGNPALAAQLDAFHPAVLRLISMAATAAAQHGRKISMCGGLASDPIAPPFLIGMGVTSLSLIPAAIAPAKALIRTLTLADCRALAQRALEQASATAVRALS
jgi:multiphosphoryl transfer protein